MCFNQACKLQDGNRWNSHLNIHLPSGKSSLRLVQTEIDSIYKALHRCGLQRGAGQGFDSVLLAEQPRPSPGGGYNGQSSIPLHTSGLGRLTLGRSPAQKLVK